MSRTEELENSGARSVGGGGEHPFVKWGEHRAYVEGRVINYWESKYGGVFTVSVDKCSDHLEAQMGRDEPMVGVEPGQTVNVGLQYSALDGLDESYQGHDLHIAFEGWEKSKSGNRYRIFKVFDITPDEPEGETEDPSGAETPSGVGAGPGGPGGESPPPPGDDDLPF